MNTTSKVILGIIGAAAAGAVIGLLLAPEKGSELRSKIKSGAGDWAKKAGDLFNAGKEEFESLKSSASKEASNYKSKAEGAFNKAKETYS
ncbi:MAG: YtxH domain-containing protein [Gemmatimonadaceae bacterium]|nr:YtxH domain-containing protein [Chitinophagaceae bacterium]